MLHIQFGKFEVSLKKALVFSSTFKSNIGSYAWPPALNRYSGETINWMALSSAKVVFLSTFTFIFHYYDYMKQVYCGPPAHW